MIQLISGEEILNKMEVRLEKTEVKEVEKKVTEADSNLKTEKKDKAEKENTKLQKKTEEKTEETEEAKQNENTEELIKDPVLKEVILEILRKDGEHDSDIISKEDLEQITEIYAPYKFQEQKIKSLEGLQYATNMVDFQLRRSSEVSDLSPLQNLDLKGLYLMESKVTDLSPLKNMKNMESLRVPYGEITDLSPLENLKKLRELSIQNNRVTDLSPLKELEELRGLIVMSNQITDISSLRYLKNLNTLLISGNRITDLSPLEGCTELGELDASYNQITDLSPLKSIKKIKTLDISRNGITDISPIKDIEINKILASDNDIQDISMLTNFYNLYVERNPKASLQAFELSYAVNDFSILEGATYSLRKLIKDERYHFVDQYDENAEQVVFEVTNPENISIDNRMLCANRLGKSTLKISYGGKCLTATISCVSGSDAVKEEDKTEKFPDMGINTGTQGVLYDGAIWDITGEKVTKVSQDKKIKKYVSRRVYFGENWTKGTYELAGLSDDNTLLYWGKKAQNSKEYVLSEVAKNVKDVYNTGYIDNKDVYHDWESTYLDKAVKHPADQKTYKNVESVDGRVIIYKDGTSFDIGRKETYPFGVKKRESLQILDNKGNLWEIKEYGDKNWKKVKEGIKDINSRGYLIGNTYYNYSGEVIKEGVAYLVDNYYSIYVLENGEAYASSYSGWSLYATDVKEFISDSDILTNKGEVYIGGNVNGYLAAQSVVKASYDQASYIHDMLVVREDGTVWKITPPFPGTCIFSPRDINIAPEIQAPNPVTNLKAASVGQKKVKLTWNASADAEGYLIYAQKNGKYGYCSMTTKATTFTDNTALDTDYNFYWVYPYVKDANGKNVVGKCLKYVYAKGVQVTAPPKAVTGLKAENAGKGKVKISWLKSAKAEGYLVYAQKKGKYAYCGMTTKETSYTDTKALDEDYNFYWVYPYVKDGSGKRVVGKCLKYVYAKGVLPAVTGLKAASAAKAVKLSWKECKGADGYIIYGKTASGIYGYKGMTTKGTTYTDKKASAKEYNFYWVYPYHNGDKGKRIIGKGGDYVYAKSR